jgi:malto-oligosyltrehalose trehalohydrolase
VRDFVNENALYWLTEFHVDGLRLDAVHAIIDESEPDIVAEIALEARRRIAGRPVHLVVENERNEARRLTRRDGSPVHYDAQWNDDLHHVLHVLVTGETGGYYVDYAELPASRLGRTLATGFGYQGEASRLRDGRLRGEPSGSLAPSAFIAFLQNHDQVGNNAFGLRIVPRTTEPSLHAAVATVLLGPQIPLLFMGEEWATERPFAFFCDFEPPLADAVREGRRREFAHFPEFQDEAALERIPDPTATSTFADSHLDWTEPASGEHAVWLARYRELLAIRAREIVPRLPGMPPFSGSYQVLGPKAVRVEWVLGDGSRLLLLANFAAVPVVLAAGQQAPADRGRLLYAAGSPPEGHRLAPASAAIFLRIAADPSPPGAA